MIANYRNWETGTRFDILTPANSAAAASGFLLKPRVGQIIVIESIFGAPGLGREFVESISKRDYSVIMGTAIFYAILVALANVVVDLSYGVVDPRIRVRR